MSASTKLKTIQSIALSAAIIIVLNLFVNFGIRTFYAPPQFDQFCEHDKTAHAYTNRQTCEDAKGFWYEPGANPHGGPYPVRPLVPGGYEEPQGWCDPLYQCNREFASYSSVYNRNVFIVLVLAGALALTVGLWIKLAAAVSTGFIFGGVVSFIVGTLRYWSDMQEYLRFIILGITLLVLIVLGYRRFRD